MATRDALPWPRGPWYREPMTSDDALARSAAPSPSAEEDAPASPGRRPLGGWAPPSPEFLTREALRLLASWDDAGNPEQYVDDVRIDLAVEVVARTYQRAQERTR